MIKANELRQGNWYRCKIYNGNNDVMMQFTWQEHKYVHLFDPIPLTPEILEQCGFKNRPKGCDYFVVESSYKLEISIEADSYKNIIIDSRVGQAIVDRRITSLHQLQNLYFALTGEELNYQP